MLRMMIFQAFRWMWGGRADSGLLEDPVLLQFEEGICAVLPLLLEGLEFSLTTFEQRLASISHWDVFGVASRRKIFSAFEASDI